MVMWQRRRRPHYGPPPSLGEFAFIVLVTLGIVAAIASLGVFLIP